MAMIQREPLAVELVRGSIAESVHRVAWAACDAQGALLGHAGDPELLTTLRSAAKPVQAVPLVTLPGAADLELRDEELAICCASHPGESRHAALAASVLALSGFCPDDLVCGPAGEPPSPLRHGCSGNHAALAVGARLLGAPADGYHRPEHPIQRHLLALLADLSGGGGIVPAMDACGIPTYGLPLRRMAQAYAALAAPSAPWERIPRVMVEFAELLGPAFFPDVQLMRATGGRFAAKSGAEGLLCVCVPGEGLGLALKVLDGNARALTPAVVSALEDLGWLDRRLRGALEELRRPIYPASTGEPAAALRLAEGDR
jgi:L-asparaginase II